MTAKGKEIIAELRGVRCYSHRADTLVDSIPQEDWDAGWRPTAYREEAHAVCDGNAVQVPIQSRMPVFVVQPRIS